MSRFTKGHTPKNKRHGLSSAPIYNVYRAMIDRCTNKKNKCYQGYGGKGITVCDRWLESFDNFLADMGVNKPGETIDRIENNKGYSRENCRWASYKTQQNNRTNNVKYTIDGQTKTLAEWCDHYEVNYKFVWHRINREGWNEKEALTTPKVPHKNRAKAKPRILIEHNGNHYSFMELSKITGIKEATLRYRARSGLPIV